MNDLQSTTCQIALVHVQSSNHMCYPHYLTTLAFILQQSHIEARYALHNDHFISSKFRMNTFQMWLFLQQFTVLSKSKVFGCTNILSLLLVHQLWKDLQHKWPFLHWDLYYIILINFLFRDHDEEFSVIDAAKKLNEVQSMKGLGRFFKQVAQSARPRIKGGDVDDFLGCITVPIKVRCRRKIIL